MYRLHNLCAVVAASLLMGVDLSSSATADRSSDAVEIDHAEILVSPSTPSTVTAYLAIWNGTNVGVTVTSVESEMFEEVTIYRNTFGKVEAVRGSVSIPGHAELLMRASGTYLQLSGAKVDLSSLDTIPLEVTYGGGETSAVDAKVVRDIDRLVRHQHGDEDTTGQ